MSFKTIGNGNSYEGAAAAGDVNGDGYGDFLIGAPQSNTAGACKILLAMVPPRFSTEMAYLVGETDNDFFGGHSWSSGPQC